MSTDGLQWYKQFDAEAIVRIIEHASILVAGPSADFEAGRECPLDEKDVAASPSKCVLHAPASCRLATLVGIVRGQAWVADEKQDIMLPFGLLVIHLLQLLHSLDDKRCLSVTDALTDRLLDVHVWNWPRIMHPTGCESPS